MGFGALNIYIHYPMYLSVYVSRFIIICENIDGEGQDHSPLKFEIEREYLRKTHTFEIRKDESDGIESIRLHKLCTEI